MTSEEFLKLKILAPYAYQIDSKSASLYLFGGNHKPYGTQPEDPQYPVLRDFWQKFVLETEGKNRMVVCEARIRPGTIDLNTYKGKGGESIYTQVLANQLGISVVRFEPDTKTVNEIALKEVTKDELQYHYFARVVYQWNRSTEKPNFEEYISKYLAEDKKESNWEGYDFSLKHMIEIHKNMFGAEFDPNDEKFFHQICNPHRIISRANFASKIVTLVRDEVVSGKIVELVQSGVNVFTCYGFGHAIVQEPVYRALL